MRRAMMAMSALLAGAAIVGGARPAAAFDFPYCIQGMDAGFPGDCSYRTYAECMASASGRDVTCNINPRVAFRHPQPPQPRRGWPKHRHHD